MEQLANSILDLKQEIRPLSRLEQQQQLFDSMTEMVGTIELIYDEAGDPTDYFIRELNLSFARFMGQPKDYLINKKISDVVGEIDGDLLDSFAQVHALGNEMKFKKFDAAANKHYQVTVWSVSKDLEGVSYVDITQSEKTEIELQKSFSERGVLLNALSETHLNNEVVVAGKAKLELVLGSLKECVWGRDLPDHQMQYITNSAESMFGFPLVNWYENPHLWLDVIHPSDLDRVQRENEDLFISGSTEIEYRIITAQKKVKWIYSNTRVVKDEDGSPYFMAGIARDITDQKQAQDQLKRLNMSLEEKTRKLESSNLKLQEYIAELDKFRNASDAVAKELRQFIETANAPIFGIDSKGLVNEWNESAERITGFKKEEVLGRGLVNTYITEDFRLPVKKVLDDALEGKETANYEFPLFTKEGSKVMVLLNSSTRRNAEGEIVGVLGVGQDITKLNDYKENLESKVKMRTQELEHSLSRERELGLLKTRFVSMASHQFRTPLAVIQSNAQLFGMLVNSEKEVLLEKYEEVTTRITSQISKMTDLMDEVLILGKITSGNVRYAPEYFDLLECGRQLVDQFNSIQKDGRVLVCETEGEPQEVYLDPKLLIHSLSNLVSNAFKYSQGKPSPRLKVVFESNSFSLLVSDHGIGIPKQEIEHLTEPFFRAYNAMEIEGTGLGLSIVDEYVQINKGELIMSSQEEVGSTFQIKFDYES